MLLLDADERLQSIPTLSASVRVMTDALYRRHTLTHGNANNSNTEGRGVAIAVDSVPAVNKSACNDGAVCSDDSVVDAVQGLLQDTAVKFRAVNVDQQGTSCSLFVTPHTDMTMLT